MLEINHTLLNRAIAPGKPFCEYERAIALGIWDVPFLGMMGVR
ncbi:hypothetical protein [Dolichospermum sp. LEGE 00240]|nr:hypothetical protein [Dolichospermum sp. LEGE 00240]